MTVRQPPDMDDLAAEPRSIDLRDYWLVVRRRRLIVLLLVVIGAIAGAGYAYVKGPTYAATAQVVVMPVTQGPLSQSSQVSTQVNMSTEQAVAQSPPVIARAGRRLQLSSVALEKAAGRQLSVTVPATTLTTSNVLQISWKAKSPRAAQQGANAFAAAYLAYRHSELASQVAVLQATFAQESASLQKRISRLTVQLGKSSSSSARRALEIRLSELTSQAGTADNQLASLPSYNVSGGYLIDAAMPTSPSGIGRTASLIIGALLGLIIGLVLAFVRDGFDDRLLEPEQLERKLGAATLAVLPPADGGDGDGARPGRAPKVVTAARPDSRAAEEVRAMRATLVAVAARRDLRTILVVSADANASSGRIAAELGVALAESGRHVLLIAADMRGSVLPVIFGLPNNAGLSDLLPGGGDPEVLIRKPQQAGGVPLASGIAQRLAVLPSGPPMPHALAVLDSSAMISLLQTQREAFEFVVLDSVPATVAADALAVAGHVDGVIVVARAVRTRGRTVEDLRRRLDHAGALLIGGIFIGKVKPGDSRHRVAGLQPAASVPRPAADRQAAAWRQPPATRPLPAIQDEVAPRASGDPVKRSP